MALPRGVTDPDTGDTTIVTPNCTIVVHSSLVAHDASVDHADDDSGEDSAGYSAPPARGTRSRASRPGPGSLPSASNVTASSSAAASGSSAATSKKRSRTTSNAAPSPASARSVSKRVATRNDARAQASEVGDHDVEGDSQPVASSSVRAGKKSASPATASTVLSNKRVKIDRTRSRSKNAGGPTQSAEPPQSTRPSVHLAAATANLSAQDFHRLAVAHLFPLLDSMPPTQSRLISDAFDAAVLQAARQTEHEKALLRLIDHDKHEKELAERVQDMLKLIRRDPSHDDIGDYMHGVALHAIAWLNKLFIVGVEHRMYLNEVFRGFRAVYSTIDQVYATEARYDVLHLGHRTVSWY